MQTLLKLRLVELVRKASNLLAQQVWKYVRTWNPNNFDYVVKGHLLEG